MNESRENLVAELKPLMRSSAVLAADDAALKLKLAVMKILKYKKGGKQPVHRDLITQKAAKQTIAVFLYCIDTHSTDFCILSLHAMAVTLKGGNKLSAEQEEISDEMCDDDNLQHYLVNAGTLCAMSPLTVHCAPNNPTPDTYRIVVYCLFSPSSKPGQDKMQSFVRGVHKADACGKKRA